MRSPFTEDFPFIVPSRPRHLQDMAIVISSLLLLLGAGRSFEEKSQPARKCRPRRDTSLDKNRLSLWYPPVIYPILIKVRLHSLHTWPV
jgi:hypothetical protein